MEVLNGLLFLVVGLVFVSSAPLEDGFDIDVGKTVENVQSILEAHPELPRLSNDDILLLLKNITEEDKKKIGVPKKEEKIMVVLPFKATDDKDMTDLFTKRPITKYVSSHSYNDVEKTTSSSVEKSTKKSNKSNSKKATTQKTPVEENKQDDNTIPFKYDDPIDVDQLSVGSSQIPLGDISAYETFKPLPLAYKQEFDVPIDVKNLLKTYDLLENSSKKKQQEIQITASSENNPITSNNDTFEYIDPSMLPAEMGGLLSELGLMKPGPANSYLPINPDDYKNTQLGEGIDPLSLVEIDDSISNDVKKRQESNSTTTTEGSDVVSAGATESPKEAEASSEGPSIEDLESSFGGSNADDDPSEAELPPPRRNGFYYMVDWNSFLEVGDGDTKVNIRFDPKLGDPHRFIPVTIP